MDFFPAVPVPARSGAGLMATNSGSAPLRNNRVIAIDFVSTLYVNRLVNWILKKWGEQDDVLAENNRTLTEFHNKYFNTDLTIDDWVSYFVYRNKGWGTVEGM
jgi:hypothetical protein